MAKKMIAWILVLVLTVSVLPQVSLAIAAEEAATPEQHSHSAAQHICEHCNEAVTWQAWGDTDTEKTTLPKGTANTVSHYYLVSDITRKGNTEVTDKADVVLCLNGYTIDGSAKDTIYRVGNTAKLTISDCTFYEDADGNYHAGTIQNGKHTGGIAGGFYAYGNGQLTMYAGILANNNNTTTNTNATDDGYSGGAIHIRGSAKVTLNNVLFTGNTSAREGGAICIRSATTELTADNCIFDGNKAGGNTASVGGGAIYGKAGKITLKDCIFRNNEATKNGGAIALVGKDAILTAENCEFTGNKASNGSAIYGNYATYTMTGCTIEKNTTTAANAGAVYVYGAIAALTECTITNNYTEKYGGSAIYMTYDGTTTLTDCTITDNHIAGTEAKTRAAVYLTKANDKLILKGKTVIAGNFVATDSESPVERGIYLQVANTVDVGGLTEGAKVLITNSSWEVNEATDIVSSETAPTAWKRTWVIHENSGQAVEYTAEKGFHFAVNTDHAHCQCGNAACENTEHKRIEYLAWNDKNALPQSGNYYLNTDVTLTGETGVNGDLELCLSGHTVTAAAGKRHISTSAAKGVSIAISDCTASTTNGIYTAGKLTGGSDTTGNSGGGAIYIRAGSTLKLFDGMIQGNESNSGGGAILISGDSAYFMYDGEISDNAAISGTTPKNGGGVYLSKGAQAYILGGTLRNNTANDGAAIYIGSTCTLSVTGGIITKNTSSRNGAVYVYNDAQVVLRNTPQIFANNGSNLYLSDAKPIQVGELTENASVAVTGVPGAFTEACGNFANNFTADNKYLNVEYIDGALHLAAGGEHKHCLCNNANTNCGHANIAWIAWDDPTSLPETGSYYLLCDIALTKEISLSKNLNLCLNGHNITAAENKRIISTPTNTSLELCITDCTAQATDGIYTAGMLTGGNDQATNAGGGAIYLRSGASFSLYAGKITGNKTISGGGALLVAGGASFTMYGGEISNNISMKADGTFTNGGAIYANRNSSIRIVDGTITTNQGLRGGAIYQYAASVVIEGGSLTNNTAADRGGAIYATESSTLTVQGGTISNNAAQVNGGGIYARITDMKVSGGKIVNNNSLKDGGGIYYREGNMDISGDVLICGNTSASVGGGVCYSGNATGTISGGIFEKNNAISGGGMIVQGNATIEMTNGIFRNHTVKSYGAAIYVYNAQLTLSGGDLTGNTTTTGGGAIYVNQADGKLIIDGASIHNNKTRNGGAIMVSNGAYLELRSGKIANNHATAAGGGIYALQSTLVLIGGSISGNISDATGGGGVYANGATVRASGVTITGNTTKGNGGGIGSGRRLVTKNGVQTSYPATVIISGSYIANNQAVYGGGLMMNGIGGKLEVYGATVTENTTKSDGAGMYISRDCTFTIKNTQVYNNMATIRAGGIYCFRSSGTITDSQIHDNTAGKPGGAMYIYRKSVVDFKNVEFYNNTAGTLGGGIYADSDQYPSVTKFEDCKFYNNTAGQRGGAFYGCPGNEFSAIRCTFTNNTARGTDKATGNGGALAVRDIAYLEDCSFSGNKAELGGAIYAGNMDKTYASNGWGHKGPDVGIDLYNCTITDNDASRNGGAMFLAMSAFTELHNVTITGNTAGEKGSAIYAEDDLTMLDVTITENVSGSNGFSVFLADSEFDGQTYFRGLFKFGGDIIITENQGGDLYLDKMTVIAAMHEGYGAKTYIDVEIDSGVLTNRVYGIYNYEGGNRVYTITYGNRSLTEPEVDESLIVTFEDKTVQDNQTERSAAQDFWLYIAIGAIALIAFAAVLLTVLKKKRAAKETKE